MAAPAALALQKPSPQVVCRQPTSAVICLKEELRTSGNGNISSSTTIFTPRGSSTTRRTSSRTSGNTPTLASAFARATEAAAAGAMSFCCWISSALKGFPSRVFLAVLLVSCSRPDTAAAAVSEAAVASLSAATEFPEYCLKEWTVQEKRSLPPLSAAAKALNLELQQVHTALLLLISRISVVIAAAFLASAASGALVTPGF